MSRYEMGFVALVIVALGTRLWDVGGRALHYDEILHAWYSWRFAEGLGYTHTPLTHGPLLFHIAAGTMKVIGSSDVAVRLVPALFGTALVAMPALFRRQLGDAGAMATAIFLAVSPSLLYFGRFVRNDIYMAVWAVALLAIMWRYMERPRAGLLLLWAAIWALAYTTKESTFLLAGMFGLYLIILSAPDLWRWARGRMLLSSVRPAGDLLIVLGTLSLPMWAPFVGMVQDLFGIVLVNADPNDPRIAAGELVRASTETGAPAGGALYMALFLVIVLCGISITIGMLWNKRIWPITAVIFVAITATLFTSLYTNNLGIFTGYWGSLGYWIAQQPVERADQPMYYYLLGLSIYEFAIAIPAILGGAYLAARGTLFDRTLVAWAALTLVLFSIAGERMPWLLVGIAVPLAFVSGRITGLLFHQARQAKFSPLALTAGAIFAIAAPLFGYEVLRSSELGAATDELWIALAATLVTLLTAAVLLTRGRPGTVDAGADAGASRAPVLATLAIGVVVVMIGFTGFSGVRAAYSYAGFERPTEMLVYSQTGQESSYAAECIERIAEGSGLGRNSLTILVGESDNFAWQWRWYLRDYTQVHYQNLRQSPTGGPSDAAIILISRSVESGMRSRLDRGYTDAGTIKHLWWFPNAMYNHVTPSSLLSDARSLGNWKRIADYFLWREMDSRMYQSTGAIYVADRYAHLAADCTTLRATDPAQAD